MIEVCRASLIYEDHGKEVFACRDIDLFVKPNEFLGIIGPSGSGKSSLLYLLSGLKVPSRGAILYDGKNLASLLPEQLGSIRLNDFGFVFQQPYLLGYLTARENVAVACREKRSSLTVDDLLERLGLAGKAHRYPHELSGGERQRACVARALYGGPRVIFADEPTASLDHANGIQVIDLLNDHRGDGSLVVVTHDPSMLAKADRVVRLVDGQIEANA